MLIKIKENETEESKENLQNSHWFYIDCKSNRDVNPPLYILISVKINH